MTGDLKSSEKRIPLSDRDRGGLGRSLDYRNIDSQEPVQIRRLGLAKIITRRQLKHAFKRTVVDLHDQETALGSAATIRPSAADAQLISLDNDFEMIAAHACQLHLNDQTAIGHVNVRVRDPRGFG